MGLASRAPESGTVDRLGLDQAVVRQEVAMLHVGPGFLLQCSNTLARQLRSGFRSWSTHVLHCSRPRVNSKKMRLMIGELKNLFNDLPAIFDAVVVAFLVCCMACNALLNNGLQDDDDHMHSASVCPACRQNTLRSPLSDNCRK